MNGEFNELYSKLSNDLAVLKAMYEQRWDSHDERASDLINELKEMKDSLNATQRSVLTGFANLECKTHREKMFWHEKFLILLWLVVIVQGVLTNTPVLARIIEHVSKGG